MMIEALIILGAVAAFGGLAWLLLRVARKLGRAEERTDRAEEGERIKDEQLEIATRPRRSVARILERMRGKRS